MYLQRLGERTPFHTIEEWEAQTGQRFPGSLGEPEEGEERVLPTAPIMTDEGMAYLRWREDLRDLFRRTLEDHRLDALYFPQASAPGRPLIEDPERPDYSPNNWPEIPSNIVNDLGVPVVTVPYAYYEDGTPFVLALVGPRWSEAGLLGYASEVESSRSARRPPALVPSLGN